MTNPKRRLRGLPDLGKAIDERIAARQGELELRHDTGRAAAAPLGGAAGSGGGGEAALPERYVETLKKSGEAEALSGELELADGGDATLTQSASAPHFTISTPEYTASDGVARAGDEFSCDATVVRTSGDQTVGGVKTFGDFPLTPSSAPGADYQAANKKYVDDQVAAVPEYWQRTGTTLSPATADDGVEVSTTDAGQSGSEIRAARFATTGDYARGVEVATSGQSSGGVRAETTGQYADAVAGYAAGADAEGVVGYASGSGADGVRGVVSGTSLGENDTYGGSFTRTKAGSWADFAEQGSAPADPPTDHVRVWAKDDGRLYATNDAGNEHDLAVQHKQCVVGALFAAGGDGETWEQAAHPSAGGAAAISASRAFDFDFGDGELDLSYGRWSWTAVHSGGTLTAQSQLALGMPFRKFGDGAARDGNCRVVLKARLRVNDTGCFDAVKLVLNDSGGNRAEQDVLASLSDDAWTEVTLAAAGTDVSGWGAALRACIWAVGKAHGSEGSYPTRVDVEWAAIEQWVE